MSTALSLVLSGMVASYETVEPSAPVSKSPAKSKAVKVEPQSATVKVSNPSAHEVKPSNVPFAPNLPTFRQITASFFLSIAAHYNVAWSCEATPARHTTPKLGKVVVDGEEYLIDRHLMRWAITCYTGWNPALDFGTQDTMARRKASQEVNPKPMAAKPSLTIAGLVAGMPDHHGKMVQDLKSRIRLAVEGTIDFGKVENAEQFLKACNNYLDPEAVELLKPMVPHMSLDDIKDASAKRVVEIRQDLVKLQKELARVEGH
jgi:hypothetical protein